MLDERADSWDLSVYGAISASVDYITNVGRIRLRRIADRSHLGEASARLHRDHLVQLGYVRLTQAIGAAPTYELLPTAAVPALQVQRHEDEELIDPQLTGRRGGQAKAPPPAKGGPSKQGGLKARIKAPLKARIKAPPSKRYPSSELVQTDPQIPPIQISSAAASPRREEEPPFEKILSIIRTDRPDIGEDRAPGLANTIAELWPLDRPHVLQELDYLSPLPERETEAADA
jgi:hypothetical protein